jgi:hypothetical protein
MLPLVTTNVDLKGLDLCDTILHLGKVGNFAAGKTAFFKPGFNLVTTDNL